VYPLLAQPVVSKYSLEFTPTHLLCATCMWVIGKQNGAAGGTDAWLRDYFRLIICKWCDLCRQSHDWKRSNLKHGLHQPGDKPKPSDV